MASRPGIVATSRPDDRYWFVGVNSEGYVSGQAPGFATAFMGQITAFQGTPNDVSEAVAARVARSRFLYEGGHRHVVLMEESVLRYRTAGPDAMRGQLRHLLAVMPLASVFLGIIPFTAQLTVWPLEAFYLHDDEAVVEASSTWLRSGMILGL
jgi:hypothetical protein